jgi:NADH-quinone oxidoreductase subunit C
VTAGSDHWPGRVRAAFADDFTDEQAVIDEGFGPLTVTVPADRWTEALELARDELELTFFDFLSAVDELDAGFRVVCHLAGHRESRRHPRVPPGVRHLVVATVVPREAAVVASAAGLFAGARWHERETHEMFGIDFTEAGQVLALDPLLLPEEFEGHPLRKEFVLASRVAKPWPGAKEPGESDHAPAAGTRRRVKPTGVPDEWLSERWLTAHGDGPEDGPEGGVEGGVGPHREDSDG